MTEPGFRALRDHLEVSAQQPDFEIIWVRRQRRTRHWAALSVAGLVVLTLVSSIWAVKGGGDRSQPPPAVPPSSAITSVTSHSTGALFAYDHGRGILYYSADRGYNWRKHVDLLRGPELATARLAAANDRDTWIAAGDYVYYITPSSWSGTRAGRLGDLSVARERLWIIADDQVQIWTARSEPERAMGLPAPVRKVAALSAEAAMVMTLASDGNAQWYYTYDSGTSWHRRPDPCGKSGPDTTMVSAPDRSLWLVCSGNAVYVSTNDGETWASRGTLPADATAVHPVTKTAAWSTGAAIHQALNGVTWTLRPGEPGTAFSAADVDTAITIVSDTANVTRDGGATWTPAVMP